MSEGIPEHVDLLRIAKSGGHYKGTISVTRMPRFMKSLAKKEGQLNADIIVATDERRQAFIEGHVDGRVWATCQRCMQAMPYEVDVSFDLKLVDSEARLQRLADGVEAIVVTEVPASLIGIIEDELILGFSLVPMHQEEDCEATSYLRKEQDETLQEAGTEKPNPFAVLKDFKLDD